ncbi:MAG: preprotein translocase subunit SecA, partial [Actinobacteria bacterium]|nr:preprotein translocase subunit SecA [Actinomycetota bacterium]
QVEARNFEIRKNVLKYDDVMNRQREVIYSQRREVLEGVDLREQVVRFREEVLKAYVAQATAEGRPEDWDTEALWTALRTVYPVSITTDEVVEQAGGATRLTAELLEREVLSDAEIAYRDREEQIGSDQMRELERRVTLSVLDRKWREHLYEMDYLKEGIGLRAMAQRDPLVEYQREGYQLFTAMIDAIKEETVAFLFNLEVQVAAPEAPAVPEGEQVPAVDAAAAAATAASAPRLVAKGIDGPERQAPLHYSAPDEDGGVELRGEPAGGVAAGSRPTAQARTGDPDAAGSANREARRRAAKQGKKRR